MGSHPDVLIVGGGVIGLTTAYYLAREGATVRVLDRATPGSEASWAGAGIIPPGNPAGATTDYDRLRAASSSAFPALSAELRERTGIDNGYRVCGGIEVFHGDSAEATRLWGVEGIAHELLSPRQSRDLEPLAVLPATEVYYLPGMAQVRNPWHVRALLAACGRLGVDVRPASPVARFESVAGRVQAVRTESDGLHRAGKFLIATGAWSDHLLGPLGVRPGIHPVLGQIVLFRPPGRLIRHILSVGKEYLVPRDDGRILAGSTEEPEAGFEKRTTAAGCEGLARFAVGLVPALTDSPIEKTWAGLRPGTPDALPYIGPVPGHPNVFVAAGHFRAGIQLSLATADAMCRLMTDRPALLSLHDFRLDRPPGAPGPSAFRS